MTDNAEYWIPEENDNSRGKAGAEGIPALHRDICRIHRYEGYITTKVGPMASKEEMEYNLRTIRDANNL